MKGPAALRKFLESNEISPAEFSRRSEGEIDEPAMSRYLAGKVTPGLKVAFLIQELTDNAVPASAWVDVKAGKRRTGGDPVAA